MNYKAMRRDRGKKVKLVPLCERYKSEQTTGHPGRRKRRGTLVNAEAD